MSLRRFLNSAFLARVGAVLLVFLQLAAPSLHVCSPLPPHLSTQGIVMACHSVPAEAGEAEKQAIRVAYRLFSWEASNPKVERAAGFCLAQMLGAMGAMLPPAHELRLALLARVLAAIPALAFATRFSFSLPPVRGPPVLH